MATAAAAPKKRSRVGLILGVIAFVLFASGIVLGAFGRAIIPQPEVHLPAQNLLNAEHHYELTDNFTFNIFKGFNLTNTLLSSWITTAVILLVFVGAAMRRKLVPGRFQGAVEMIVVMLHDFVESVVGKEYARRVFPIIATIFIFVLFNAWIGLLPIIPVLGFKDDEGHIIATLFRPAGTDVNMPLAVAIASFLSFEFWAFRAHGVGYMKEFVRVGEFKNGPLLGAIQTFFVGPLEFVSHLIRMVSFTFRLFGNMLAGEVLLGVMTFLFPFTVVVLFYSLELLVGVIQALVFAGLTLAFTGLSVASHGEHEEHREHSEEAGHAGAPAH